jgi:hypothetical protein
MILVLRPVTFHMAMVNQYKYGGKEQVTFNRLKPAQHPHGWGQAGTIGPLEEPLPRKKHGARNMGAGTGRTAHSLIDGPYTCPWFF